MKNGYKNILLTGEPGCGKTTALIKLIEQIGNKKGIITEQILDKSGKRIGFNIADSEGNSYLMASKIETSDILFANKYRIHTDGIQKIIHDFSYNNGDLLYLDEVAPMELFASGFQEFCIKLLESKNTLIGCIKLDDKGYDFLKQIKKREDTLIINLSQEENRSDNIIFLENLIKKIIKSQKYIIEKERFSHIGEGKWIMKSSSDIRKLEVNEKLIICNCSFYNKYGICSHSIALRQLM